MPDVDADLGADDRDPGRSVHADVLAAVSVGGVLGAEARYALGRALPTGAGVPWTTLAINVAGSLLIGVLIVVVTELRPAHRLARPLLGVGVLGGFTTFSAYAVDIVRLSAAGSPGAAAVTLVLTPVAAVAAAWCGAASTRRLAR